MIDRKLDENDLARRIPRLVDETLDLTPLFSSYAGRGSLAHRPDRLLKMVLYTTNFENLVRRTRFRKRFRGKRLSCSPG